jgi:hypothetical protein
LISAPFNCGTGTVSTLLDVFGTNQLRQSFLSGRCDQVLLWDNVQQRYVQYAQKTNGLFYFTTNFTGAAQNPYVTRGQAIWIKAPVSTYAPSEKTIVISGNVPNDGAFTNSIVGDSGKPFSFIANPYPVEMDLNELINTNDGAKGGTLTSRADKILLWDTFEQKYINLSLKLSTTVPAVNNKWLYTTNFTASVAPAIYIKPGNGFWYQTTNAFTWVENKTYILE